MIKRLNVSKEILKLIPLFYLQSEGDDVVFVNKTWLFGGTHLLEDMSLALGMQDRAISGTEDDADGRAFSEEDTKTMMDIYSYISENLFYFESLIHQFSVRGGITEGVYKCKDNELIWEKES